MMASYLGAGAVLQDWNDIYNASGARNADQSVDLPLHGSFNLSNIAPLLASEADYDSWLGKIEKTLRVHNVHQLIDTSVPKPLNTSPNAKNWYQLSLQVREWLTTCIEPELVHAVNRRGQPVNFADDFMRELKLQIKCEGHHVMRTAAFELLLLGIGDFTVTQFITEFRQKFETARGLDTHISPWLALTFLLEELKRVPQMREIIQRQHEGLFAMEEPGNLNMLQFNVITAQLLRYVEQQFSG
jgi:hypothetical protein